MDKKIRLDRFLADMGVGTRSQIRDMAKKGRIEVSGVTVRKTDEKIQAGRDIVRWDGEEVAYVKAEYYMLNKPSGVVSATEDNLHETVIDLVMKHPPKIPGGGQSPKRKDLFPVGRLDIDTEGLLLITNDGELAHRLLSPRRHVDKRYFARITGKLPEDARKRFEEGLTLSDGTKLLPAHLEARDGGKENQCPGEVAVTIREGKFHQVKRMFEALGCRVVYLKRLSMGSLVLDESLKPGEYRPLSEKEVEELKTLEKEPTGL